MDSDTVQRILNETQQVARLLAPYQNLGKVSVVDDTLETPTLLQRIRGLFWKAPEQSKKGKFPAELTTKDVTRIVNTLCNCVCVIDALNKNKIEENPCPTNSEVVPT